MHDHVELGTRGETLAAAHLASLGYLIRERNWRATGIGLRGELDLIALAGRTLVVVEVKTRRTRWTGAPAEAVGHAKRRQLRLLTSVYLSTHPHSGPIRGDVVAIDLARGTDGMILEHFRG